MIDSEILAMLSAMSLSRNNFVATDLVAASHRYLVFACVERRFRRDNLRCKQTLGRVWLACNVHCCSYIPYKISFISNSDNTVRWLPFLITIHLNNHNGILRLVVVDLDKLQYCYFAKYLMHLQHRYSSLSLSLSLSIYMYIYSAKSNWMIRVSVKLLL